MANEQKQTLFRFKTMRAPELLSADAKTKYFIEHPDGSSGPFYAAVSGMGMGDTKKGVLAVAAAAFTGAKTKAGILAINSRLSDFGLYLLKNRHKLTVADITTEIAGLTALSGAQELAVWDSLFYQTITVESGYAREAALQLILANYFVNEFSGMDMTDESMQKWANSRVVMPLELFELDSKYLDPTTDNKNATGEELLSHFIEAAEAKIKAEIVAKAEEEVEAYKTSFLKTHNANEKSAMDAHDGAIKAAQANATEVDQIDQFSQYTFKRLTNYTAPTYSYQRPVEVDQNSMVSTFSEETDYLLQDSGLYDSKTFEELEDGLGIQGSSLARSIFDRTNFFSEKVAIDGTLVSKCGIEHRLSQKYAFMIKLVKKAANKYGAVLTVDLGADCLKLDTVVANFKAPINSGFTAKKGFNSKGILTVDLLPGQSIDLTSQTGIEVSGELLFSNGLKLDFAKDFVGINGYMSGIMTRNADSDDSSELYVPSGFGISRLGIADYRKVEQTLCCYVPGEVSHIENVMAREYKERSTRRMRRTDDKTTTSSSLETENMTDTSTTTRFDMQKEISKVLSESMDRSKSAGFNSSTSGKSKIPLAGEVDFTVGSDFSSDFATSTSSEDSNSQSTSFAKDVTQKAMQRVVSNVSEERTIRIIEEFEEKNQHGFDNRQGSEHISGVYRWVDKIYKNEIQNYGKRLQYEFMIPEPSLFHLIAKASGTEDINEVPLIKPLDPRKETFGILEPIRNSAHILPTNYHQWAAAYGATVTPPPNKYLTVSKTINRPADGAPWYDSTTVKDEIIIPAGYGVESIRFSVGGNSMEDWSYFLVSAAGITRKFYENDINNWLFADADGNPQFREFSTSIPISAQFTGFQGGLVSFSVKLKRKHSLMEEWQLKTFKSIMDAYEDRLLEYKDGIAEMKTRKDELMKDNPAYHRRIENTVLKKNCISYLAGHVNMGQSFTTGAEMANNQVRLTEEMDQYAGAVKFFEQAFEWNLMDYHFYPFYWANKDRWTDLYGLENEDELFRAFLRAGMARTVVTVRPGFEEAVMYYMATGLIWNGGEVPVIGDDLYLSIIDELKDPEYKLEETWETRLPSTLTVIQAKTIALDAEGLPCYCEDGVPPTENIETPAVDPLTGLDVHIDGLTPPA